MTSSGLDPTGAVQLPLCYDSEGYSVTPPNTLLPAYYGAGGVYTSAADMVHWLTFSAGLRTTPLQPLVSFMWTRQRTDPAVAEGWFIRENLNPIWLVKNGGSPGASSWMGVCPDLPAIAFVMSNATALADRIGAKILGLLTGGNAEAPTDR